MGIVKVAFDLIVLSVSIYMFFWFVRSCIQDSKKLEANLKAQNLLDAAMFITVNGVSESQAYIINKSKK